MEDNSEAGRTRKGTAKRQAAKPSGGGDRRTGKTTRIQLHLGKQTVKRLGVHCAIAVRNQSGMADQILAAWLRANGKGREAFSDADPIDPDFDPDVPT